jgi:hypothetical protein
MVAMARQPFCIQMPTRSPAFTPSAASARAIWFAAQSSASYVTLPSGAMTAERSR